MRLWEDTVLRAPSLAYGKPPELPNLPQRLSVEELLQTPVVRAVKKAWRRLRRAAA
jgi:hypothetical protein